jgi:Ni,Fe-hydrogenase III small subunit
MMKAKLIRAWACAPEGHTVVRFEANTIVDGRIAELALADGVAIEHREMVPLDVKIDPAPFAPRGRGRPRKEASE